MHEILGFNPSHFTYIWAQIFWVFKMQRIALIYVGTWNKQAWYKQKNLNIDGHLVSTLGGCGGLERTDF